jgi:hypothetical protein
MKKIEDLTIMLLLVLLLGLASCAKPKVVDQQKQPTLIETIGNMGKAGKAIGCVFAPWNKECQRIKDEKAPHQTQEEYLDEVNKEFDQLEEDIQKSKVE